MEQGPLGLNPELRTPPLPATHVRAGTDHRVLARNYTTDKVGPPTCEFTRDVRPRVATSYWCSRRPGCVPPGGARGVGASVGTDQVTCFSDGEPCSGSPLEGLRDVVDAAPGFDLAVVGRARRALRSLAGMGYRRASSGIDGRAGGGGGDRGGQGPSGARGCVVGGSGSPRCGGR